MRRVGNLFAWFWKRLGDASLIAWLFPSIWAQIVPIVAALGTLILGVAANSPPIVWIPAALAAGAIALIIVHLVRLFQIKPRTPETPEKLADQDLRARASKWLASRLSDKTLHVKSVRLFGSVIRDHYPTSDVDVIIAFNEINDRKLEKAARAIKEKIRPSFEQSFGHKLHVTFFCANEETSLAKFITDAGETCTIYPK